MGSPTKRKAKYIVQTYIYLVINQAAFTYIFLTNTFQKLELRKPAQTASGFFLFSAQCVFSFHFFSRLHIKRIQPRNRWAHREIQFQASFAYGKKIVAHVLKWMDDARWAELCGQTTVFHSLLCLKLELNLVHKYSVFHNNLTTVWQRALEEFNGMSIPHFSIFAIRCRRLHWA